MRVPFTGGLFAALVAPTLLLAQQPGELPTTPTVTFGKACSSCEKPTCQDCPPRLWGGAEYLMWWTKNAPVPTPLVTLASPSSAVSGALGEPGTQILIGADNLNLQQRQGGRFTLGRWLTTDAGLGVEGSYFFLTTESTSRTVGGDGSPGSLSIGVPFFDPSLPGESFLAFAEAGVAAGFHRLTVSNRLQGAEGNVVARLGHGCGFHLDGLAGFRYLRFKERLTFASSTTAVTGGIAADASLNTLDDFECTNDFYGGQLGLRGEFKKGGFFVNATGKVALGGMNEVVDISGRGILTIPALGVNQTAAAGLFAADTNSGRHESNHFAVVPEANLNVGYETCRVRVFVGYTGLYASNVVRPGRQIDHAINTTGSILSGSTSADLVGDARPAFLRQSSSFWAQGLNFGFEFKY